MGPRTTRRLHKHMSALVVDGSVIATGETRSREYRLAETELASLRLDISSLQEDVVWRRSIAPHVSGLPENVVMIWQ